MHTHPFRQRLLRRQCPRTGTPTVDTAALLQMCPPRLRYRCVCKLTLTPSDSQGAVCPPDYMTHSICAPWELQQELLEKYGKSTAALLTQGLVSTPARISKEEKTLPHFCGWAFGGVHDHSAASADFSSSQQVPNTACGTRGSGKRRSQSPWEEEGPPA